MSSTQEAGEIFGAGRGPAHAMLRSPTVLIASVGLWGMNIFFFRLFRIDYVKIFKRDLLKLEEQEHEDYERYHHYHHHLHHKDSTTSNSSTTNSLLLNNNNNNNDNHHLLHNLLHHHNVNSSDNINNSIQNNNNTNNSIHNNSNTTENLSSSSPSPHRTPPLSSKSLPPVSGNDSIHKHLVQRQPSAGTLLIAAAAASATTTTTTESGDEEELEPNNYQQHLHHRHTSNGNDDDDDESPPDLEAAISWSKLVGLSMILLVLLHSTYYWWLDILHGGTIGAVFMFYALVLVGITVPLRCSRWLRKATVIVVQRTYELINPRCHCITNDGITPPRFVPFVDVFYADAMCSLSKVFFDWGMLFHMATHYPNPVPASAHNILIPSACAAIPYIIRARQCLIMYTVGRLQKERNRFSHLWNAFKYSTSIFPLCLSAYQQTVPKTVAQELESLLIFLLVVNTVIALYWDIVMDWGMMQENPLGVAFCNTGANKPKSLTLQNPHKAVPTSPWVHSILRPKLRFGFAMSTLILVMDGILRFSWMLRFHKHTFFPNADSFVLCTQFLEVFRRALWNLLRVEWENIKHQQHAKHHHTANNKLLQNTTNDASGNIQAAVEEELKHLLPSSLPIKINTL